MLPEISLHILDIVQNSIKAEAKSIHIGIKADTARDLLCVEIEDDGTGMTQEQLQNAMDPFYTTRTTRKTGFGLSFLKYAAEFTGGSFELCSKTGQGTTVTAVFKLSSINRMPMGSITDTVRLLIASNPQIDFIYSCRMDERAFTLDTREIREIMGDIPLDAPEIACYLKEYLSENHLEIDPQKIL